MPLDIPGLVVDGGDGGDNRQLMYDTANAVINAFIGATPPKQFTLFDVTTEVRKILGRGVFVPHYDKDGTPGVHDMTLELLGQKIDDPALGWNRVLITPPGLPAGAPRPQLYYHTSTDPATYGQANPTVTVSLIQPDGMPAPDPTTTMGTVLAPAAKDRRLCIPKALMESQGLQAGEQVLVITDPTTNCLIIKKDDPNIVATPAATYTVDLRGTIRVSKNILDSVGLVGNQFTAVEDPTLGLVIRA